MNGESMTRAERRAAARAAEATGAAKYLFTTEGEAALAEVVGARALYAFDFDGTLAPIESRPERVRTPSGVQRLLKTLGQLVPVAVISGRQRADLQPRLPDTVRHMIGNHGNEGGAANVDTDQLATVCENWRRQLVPRLVDAREAAGVMLEDKGLSLSLHYRLSRNRDQAYAWLQQQIETLKPPPRVIGGKLVINLLPPNAVTKFEALQALAEAEGAERVLFVGDDETDEIVFDRAPPHWLTVRVELARDSRARYFVHRQSGVLMLLDTLVKRLSPAEPPAGAGGGEPGA